MVHTNINKLSFKTAIKLSIVIKITINQIKDQF